MAFSISASCSSSWHSAAFSSPPAVTARCCTLLYVTAAGTAPPSAHRLQPRQRYCTLLYVTAAGTAPPSAHRLGSQHGAVRYCMLQQLAQRRLQLTAFSHSTVLYVTVCYSSWHSAAFSSPPAATATLLYVTVRTILYVTAAGTAPPSAHRLQSQHGAVRYCMLQQLAQRCLQFPACITPTLLYATVRYCTLRHLAQSRLQLTACSHSTLR